MADFRKAFAITMRHEGGYANNPKDTGGETWAGVARDYWPNWKGWKIVDSIKATKPANLDAALRANKELAAYVLAFYKANFWDYINLSLIESQEVANSLFDIAVNMGVGRAAKFLQQSLAPAVVVDGKIGPKTLDAVNAADPVKIYNLINKLRANKYEEIIAANPSQKIFRKSWFSRIKPFEMSLS